MFSSQTALLVHSKWPMRRLTQANLISQGWRVITASSAEEAFRALNSNTVQMIAYERNLKDSSGKFFKDALRRHPKAMGVETMEIGKSPLFPMGGLSVR